MVRLVPVPIYACYLGFLVRCSLILHGQMLATVGRMKASKWPWSVFREADVLVRKINIARSPVNYSVIVTAHLCTVHVHHLCNMGTAHSMYQPMAHTINS